MGLSWKPERKGDIYCSPGCGRGCTRQEYLNAGNRGSAMAATLGPGWTYKVWENLGWHYKAVSECDRITVHLSHLGGEFFALLGEAGSGGGRWSGHGMTPQSAVDIAIQEAREELSQFADLLEGL
jgi:hypothetical protein